MNQSELEVNTCRRRQGRENAWGKVTIGFGFTSDWFIKLHEIFLATHKVEQRKNKAIEKLPLTLNWKPLYNKIISYLPVFVDAGL